MRSTTLFNLLAFLLYAPPLSAQVPALRSHPPLREAHVPSDRPAAKGPGYFVDSQRGDDAADGKEATPWRTLGHALKQLKAGDTLYLRSGAYYENAYVAARGKEGAPITIRSAPGEVAVIDGSLREFFDAPAEAWQPAGANGEYRSKRAYPNLRDVLGSFGDSMIGLQTYHHAQDLRATNERIDWNDWANTAASDIKPLYVGPGLWYDAATGRIHLRLAHTKLPKQVPNYQGETDPRKLPLLLAPFTSVPLKVDGAEHVRFQDLVIRGGGYTTVLLDHANGVEFDNVTVWCGTYGLRVAQTRSLHFRNSALYGNVAPWTFRTDASKRDYPGRPHRNISRLNTHALLEIDAGRESSVYATPQNDQWEFSHSEFADAHDGLYLGGINVRFHHNRVENLQDDGIYLSPMYHRHRLDAKDPEVFIHHNLFRQMLTALAFGGTEAETRDKVFIYRNVFDLRGDVPTGRPTTKKAEASYSAGKVIGDHGSPPWSALNIYHNTFVMAGSSRDAAMATVGASKTGRPRRVFNNLFLHLGNLPAYVGPLAAADAVEDGNLYWAPGTPEKTAAAFFARYRASTEFTAGKKFHPDGSSTNSRVADPKLAKVEAGDFRLTDGSPAVDAGLPLPEGWPDDARAADKNKPDVGALPLGAKPLTVGRKAKP